MKGIIWVDDFSQTDDLGNIFLSYGVQHWYHDFFKKAVTEQYQVWYSNYELNKYK